MPLRAVLSEDLYSEHSPYWNFFFLGFLLFHLHFECRGPPWVESSKEVKKKFKTNKTVLTIVIREGNGTPLQYSCLENPWMEEPGRLQSMGSLRVGHD